MKRGARIWWLLVLAVLAGCVTKKKHNATVSELKDKQAQLEKELQENQDERKKSESALALSQDDLKKLTATRDELDARVRDLEQKLGITSKERDSVKGALSETESNLKATSAELEDLRRQRAEAEKRLEAVRRLTARLQAMIDSGKLKVKVRGGRMIVELPAGILFASGKADLSKEGQTAIAEVAAILKDFSDRKFIVAGHTDNVALKSGKFRDNWDLSTGRAITVTTFLIEKGVSPTALSAAGYGEFDPIADNGTEEGRQQNRRIEIVLAPNIEALPGEIGS